MIRAFAALGSNLDGPQQQLQRALEALATAPACRLGAVSPFYANPAVGPGEQPDYVNAVAELFTDLAPEALLDLLQSIENAQGRERTRHWGARTLDLDLLLYGDSVTDLPRLQVPHPRMFERDWVLYPLADIAPDLVFPDGSHLAARLDSCPDRGLRRL
jgi:2-amino-4-hydroxy-6-hydroxymethyldihydropteridine diphosphokinase